MFAPLSFLSAITGEAVSGVELKTWLGLAWSIGAGQVTSRCQGVGAGRTRESEVVQDTCKSGVLCASHGS